MENLNNQNNIGEDKKLAEQLFSKEVLNNFEKNNTNVPSNYFQNFEARLLNNIHTSKQPAHIFNIAKWGQLAIAASFLAVIVSSYLFLQSSTSMQQNQSMVSLQEIPSAEIDAYVNSNEWVAEIDWQEEINIESTHLERLNSRLIKDSNDNQ